AGSTLDMGRLNGRGALGETRTLTGRDLNAVPLPIGLRARGRQVEGGLAVAQTGEYQEAGDDVPDALQREDRHDPGRTAQEPAERGADDHAHGLGQGDEAEDPSTSLVGGVALVER